MNKLFIFLTAAVWYVCVITCFQSDARCEFEPFRGEVNTASIHIRTDSTVNSEIICKALKKQPLDVIGESFEWYKIKIPFCGVSFIRKDLIRLTGEKTGEVTVDLANIRLRPSESSPVIGKAVRGEMIEIIKETKGWYKIQPVEESFGWIHKKFVHRTTPEKLSEPPVESSSSPEQENGQENNISLPEERVQAEVSAVIPDAAGIDESKQEELAVEGIVKTYGNVFNRKATHKLITKNKKTYLLKYNRVILNTVTFHTIRAYGTLIPSGKHKYPVLEVKKIEIID